MAASHRNLEAELEYISLSRGADFVSFVNISQLPRQQRREYPGAILFGMALSPEYIQLISSDRETNEDHFHITEGKTDQLADYIALYLTQKGLGAYSQSEKNLIQSGNYNENTKSSPLPHKTIARLAGLGWIGKHNLLISKDYGSAISMSSVLTDAPIKTILNAPVNSECGTCDICTEICSPKAIKGNTWKVGTSRDEMLDVSLCSSCLKCLALCPWTQDYVKSKKQ